MKSYISVPKVLMKEITNNLFFKGIQENKCKIGFLDTIGCDCEYAKEFGKIAFIFDGYGYELQGRELFDEDIDFNIFTFIMSTHSKKDLNHISIGIYFIRHFDIFFKYDESSIHLFSNRIINKVYIKANTNHITTETFILLLCFLSIGSA